MTPAIRPLALAACAALSTLALPLASVRAQDKPGLDIVGFNGRGFFYGIEQYGLRPRTRTPYSEIHIYDLRTGEEIHRSPFIYDLKEKIPEGVSTKQAIRRARDEVYFDAKRVIRYLTLVPRGKTFTPADEKARKAMFIAAPGLSGALELKTFPLSTPRCPGVKTVGYALIIKTDKGEKLIHKTSKLPGDLGCPVDYELASANVYMPVPDLNALAVVLAARQGGKDAGDVRYTATGRLFDNRKKK